jgi:hypothetical protein
LPCHVADTLRFVRCGWSRTILPESASAAPSRPKSDRARKVARNDRQAAEYRPLARPSEQVWIPLLRAVPSGGFPLVGCIQGNGPLSLPTPSEEFFRRSPPLADRRGHGFPSDERCQ